MTQRPERRLIRDEDAIRAMAHPLRVRLLHHLLSAGPSTATECAEAVGSSPSNCSWHLRQLAEHGLVEPTEAADGRQRPWQATAVGFDFGTFDEDPALRTAQEALVAAELNEESRLTQRFLDGWPELPEDWQRAAAHSSYGLRVTAGELRELTESIDALLKPYRAVVRPDPPLDAKPVYLGLRAFLRLPG